MKKLVFGSLLAGGLFASACSNSPAGPSVSFTSPISAGPTNGSSYKYKAQPVTLSITNAVRTGRVPAAYAVEIATDPGFGTTVLTRTDIAEGEGSTTSVALPGLPASAGNVTYYWRSWAIVDGVDGPKSPTQSFVVQQQIVVNPPAISEPASGTTTAESRPGFTTRNAARQGAVGDITYTFQVSKVSNFSSIVLEATIPEQSGGQTTWTPRSDLPAGTLFWRVQARDDANAEVSAFTNPVSFVVEPFDPFKAHFWNGPNVADWDQTAKITSVRYDGGYFLIDFDKRDGPGAWPEVSSGGFGPLQYTAGMCFNLGGEWHCSAPVQFWAGRELEAGGPWRDIHVNWFYDPARWGPMAGYQPECGERVAVWVGQGNLRGNNGNTINQRSNFALFPFCSVYSAQ
jgi:hypothetical protein